VYEILGSLFGNCGVQSNIQVSAKYTHRTQHLTPVVTYRALARLIDEHPALSLIWVSLPSDTKKGNHRLWEAQLPSINLQDCVEFINEDIDSDGRLAKMFERCHNQWFNTQDITKPWWKLLIANGAWATFVYHHNVGDGISGYGFHRSFLAALNRDEADSTITQITEVPMIVGSSTKSPQPPVTDGIDINISKVHLLKSYVLPNLIRYFIKRKHTIFSDTVQPKDTPKLTNRLQTADGAITRIKVLRIEKSLMKKCLLTCNANKTSFTSLLHTLIQVTLAIDLYPAARHSFSRLAINLRPFLTSTPGPDVFTNAASIYYLPCRTSRFRNVSSTHPQDLFAPDFKVSEPQVWRLSREYKEKLNQHIEKRYMLQDFLAGKYFGEDNEEVMKRYRRGMYQGNSILVSNLGVFNHLRQGERREEADDGEWKIEDVGFSTAAIKAGLADFPLAFSICSVKGGNCMISASFEKDVLGENVVCALLNGVLRRLQSLLGC
jgi:hypothetical protein